MLGKPLKICIDLPGSISHGLWSPERGESRWAQNLAWGLAERGHKVIGYSYMYGGPQWGKCPPVPGVTLLHYKGAQAAGPYDVFVDNCFWEGKPRVVKAQLTIIGKYGYEEWVKNESNDTLVASPYNSSWLKELPGAVWLPAPYWRILEPPRFKNPGIVLPSRDVAFRGNLIAGNASSVLDILLELQDIYQVAGHHFLIANSGGMGFVENPPREGELQMREKHLLLEKARKLRGHLFYSPTPWGDILDLFRHKARLNLPLLNPSNVIDATMCGVPSVLWDNGGYEWLTGVAESFGGQINYGASKEELQALLERFLGDEGFYLRALEAHREAILPLQWDKALDIWEKEVYARL